MLNFGGDLPSVSIALSELEHGIGVLAAFVTAGLVASNGEARRAIAGNALSVNDVRVSDEKAKLSAQDINAEGVIKLSMGKKKHVLVRPV